MSILKIRKSQFDKILLYEERKRNMFLTENAKNLALTIALLSGVKLTGQNEYTVNNLIKDKKNMLMVKDTLEDENKVQELVDALNEKGMKDPEGSLSKNADKIVNKFNEISKKENLGLELDFLTITNLKNLIE